MHRLLRDAAEAVCIRLARCRCVAGGVVHERAVDIREGDGDLHIQKRQSNGGHTAARSLGTLAVSVPCGRRSGGRTAASSLDSLDFSAAKLPCDTARIGSELWVAGLQSM